MAFPTITDEATSSDSSASTGHTVVLPTTVNAGETLLTLFAHDDDVENVTFPAGWTKILDLDSGATVGLAVAYRKADGTEGGTTINVTTASAEETAHHVYSIAGATDPTVRAPEVLATTGNSTQPNSPSLSPTGGEKDYLWFSAIGADASPVVNSFPSGYSNTGSEDSSPSSGNCTVAWSEKTTTAASEDPGIFNISISEQWVAATIAIHPFEAVTFLPNIIIS